MSEKTVVVETKGKVGVIRLNRPQALNALNAALMTELGAAISFGLINVWVLLVEILR